MAKKDWMVKESDLEKDDYEYKVLKAVLDKSIIVSGCAGSGKSVLALIKAQRVQREKGDNYKIIVFTKALCKYMNSGKDELGLKNDFFYHWDWKYRHNCPPADYFIVDEIQDFTQEEIDEFFKATKKNFFFFGDTAQSIYGGLKKTMPVNRISGIVPLNMDFETFNLCHNYRLPLGIAKVAQNIGVGLPPLSENVYKSPEKSSPRFIRYENFESQIKAIAKMIKTGRFSDVGILMKDNASVDMVSKLFNDEHITHELKSKTADTLDFSTSNPKIITYHSAKGLQFETVFLPDVQIIEKDKDEDEEKKKLYVAMTRTYRNLYVMYSGDLPYPLSDVPQELYKTTETDEVEDI